MVDIVEAADIETASVSYASRFAGAVGAWFLEVQERATLELLAGCPRSRVLDVGGGHGQLTGALVRAGYDVTVQGSALECGARIEQWVRAGAVRFDVASLLDLPYADCAFDVVLCYRLLPHVARWRALVAELARVARHAVLVDYPERRSANAVTPLLFPLKKRLEGNTRPYRVFRRAELLAAFGAHGFEYAAHRPEFFVPMVVHRKLNAPGLSRAVEAASRALGLTRLFGSPVILKVERRRAGEGG